MGTSHITLRLKELIGGNLLRLITFGFLILLVYLICMAIFGSGAKIPGMKAIKILQLLEKLG